MPRSFDPDQLATLSGGAGGLSIGPTCGCWRIRPLAEKEKTEGRAMAW